MSSVQASQDQMTSCIQLDVKIRLDCCTDSNAIFRFFKTFLQQSGGGVNVQLPQVGGASVLGSGSQAGVVAIQGQNVTSTAHNGTQHLLQQQAPPSQQQNTQGSTLTQVRNTPMLISL